MSVNEHLWEFTSFVNGKNWKQWSNAKDFWQDFPKVLGNESNRIHFNLTLKDNSMMNVFNIINNHGNIINQRTTAWELNQIYNNKEWLSRTTFYFNNEIVKLPTGL